MPTSTAAIPWRELLGFALAIGFSPLHIGMLLLLLLGQAPLRRGGWFVAGWLVTSALMVVLLLVLGHGLLLSMTLGSSHRTGLDLLGAGALLALGIREIMQREGEGEPPAWTRRLNDFTASPLPLLLGLSALLQVVSPDDFFLYAKTAAGLLAAGLAPSQEAVATFGFAVISGLLLLLPLLAVVLVGQERLQPRLESARSWLFGNGDLLVGGISLLLAAYLGWQGIEGLRPV